MSQRITRPHHERRRPDRTVSRMIGRADDRTEGTGGLSDAISKSVGVGYRIIEEYLQQSRDVAAKVAPRAIADPSNVADLTARMMRTTADLFEMWFQFLDTSRTAGAGTQGGAADGVARGAGPAAPAGNGADAAAAHGNGASTGAAPGAPTRVAIRVSSASPATVSIDLRTARPGAHLVLHALRSPDKSCGRIDDVSITAPGQTRPALVEIRVRDDQPAGVYNGMIIDAETSLPAGTVSVVLAERADE